MKIIPRRAINFEYDFIKIFFRNLVGKSLIKGPALERFSNEFCLSIGMKNTALVPSARLGLYLLLKTYDFRKGDEVIISSLGFPFMAYVFTKFGVKLNFVDISEDTFNIDAKLIEERITKNTRAIFVTHIAGNPCEMDKIVEICQKYSLLLFEDCAHDGNSSYKGKRIGSFGDASFFSFGIGKHFTTMSGGAVLIKSDDIYEKFQKELGSCVDSSVIDVSKLFFKTLLVKFLMSKIVFSLTIFPIIYILSLFHIDLEDFLSRKQDDFSRFENWPNPKDFINFSNLQAELGLAQLSNLEMISTQKKTVATKINSALSKVKELSLPKMLPGADHDYTYFMAQIKGPNKWDLKLKLLSMGIDFKFSSQKNCQKLFDDTVNLCPTCARIEDHLIKIPNSFDLDPGDVNHIVNSIEKTMLHLSKSKS